MDFTGRGRGRSFGGDPEVTYLLGDLRRPHPVVPAISSVTASLQETTLGSYPLQTSQAHSKDDIVKNSVLSPDAPEFVPQGTCHYPVTNNQPDIPHSYTPMPIQFQEVIPQPQTDYIFNPIIILANNLVVQLTLKPEKFDKIAQQFASVLTWQVKSVDLMKEIISVIFEQGVGEVNFRYCGARLCQFLSKNVTQNYNGANFRGLLLDKCNEEFNAMEVYLQVEPKRLCGFTSFMAELYAHLLTPTGQPIQKLRESMFSLLMLLIRIPLEDNLKCVSQVLKLIGSSLDSGDQIKMNALITLLKDLSLTGQLSHNIKAVLLSVVELRAANWGRDASPSTETSQNVPLGTVYYGSDGSIQKIEEEFDDYGSDSEDLSLVLPPNVEELEGEVAAAFEEFLQLKT